VNPVNKSDKSSFSGFLSPLFIFTPFFMRLCIKKSYRKVGRGIKTYARCPQRRALPLKNRDQTDSVPADMSPSETDSSCGRRCAKPVDNIASALSTGPAYNIILFLNISYLKERKTLTFRGKYSNMKASSEAVFRRFPSLTNL
jgi:hypothetical protein